MAVDTPRRHDLECAHAWVDGVLHQMNDFCKEVQETKGQDIRFPLHLPVTDRITVHAAKCKLQSSFLSSQDTRVRQFLQASTTDQAFFRSLQGFERMYGTDAAPVLMEVFNRNVWEFLLEVTLLPVKASVPDNSWLALFASLLSVYKVDAAAALVLWERVIATPRAHVPSSVLQLLAAAVSRFLMMGTVNVNSTVNDDMSAEVAFYVVCCAVPAAPNTVFPCGAPNELYAELGLHQPYNDQSDDWTRYPLESLDYTSGLYKRMQASVAAGTQ